MTDTPLSLGQFGWQLDHSYAQLPSPCFRPVNPTPVREPRMMVFNDALAGHLGLSGLLAERADLFAGNALPDGAHPIAQAYAGHQYANFTMLGDGRAILLGEQLTPRGERFDVQLKGPGPTPFSRRGDGRAALGPMLREYIISEAMHALGIPTTRSLAVVATGETVYRQQALPGAVLTRIAASHIRVGTFEWAASCGEPAVLKALANYTLQRHFPEVAGAEKPHLEMLKAIIERQATLIAKWMSVGFIHGVMNTDNMALSGETIDYGPCAFMDTFDPETVFSSIDQNGRYAYGNQPQIAQWNLARLAEALLPLLHEDEDQAVAIANEAINGFKPRFQHHWLAGMRAKLGLFNAEAEDIELIQSLLEWMQETNADFTNTFRALSSAPLAGVVDSEWHERWIARVSRQSQTIDESVQLMRANNPAVIPRNHMVEEALEAASQHGDLTVMHRLLNVLTKPFDEPTDTDYTQPAPAGGCGYQTFCGT